MTDNRHRRPEFDSITMGWGADTLPDLYARRDLLRELVADLSGFTPAEQKIATAIDLRIKFMESAERGFLAPEDRSA